MKAALQAKLLHVLQDGQFTKLGSNKIDRRRRARRRGHNRDLETMLISGEFREDLYYRLKVIEVTVPPLRERRTEIPHLTGFSSIGTRAATTGRPGSSPRRSAQLFQNL